MISKNSFDISTIVSVEYSNLPRCPSIYHICSGTLQYCPELAGHAGGSATGLAYVDKPSKPQNLAPDHSFNVQYERVGEVPKYDHVTEVSLDSSSEAAQPAGCSAQKSAGTIPRRQSRRCFNCGSFLHSLKDCPETRDAGAIAQARRESQQGRPSLGSERYFTAAPEEFADLKPGVLSAELRMALGCLGSADPPPWLHRMRDLGYPPGYMALEPEPREHNGLVLLDDTAEQRGDVWGDEHGEVGLDSYSSQIEGTVAPAQRQLVAIPGINAPVPEDADLEKWSTKPSTLYAKSGQASPRKRRRMDPPCHSSNAPPQYAPQYVPDVQAWTPQPPPGLYGASSDPLMQQGFVTPPPPYPGGQPGSMPFYAPSLQAGPMPYPHSQSPAMGYPGYPAATPSLPSTRQYGHLPQLVGGSYYHSGLHMHPMAGAYGLPNCADAGMLQERCLDGYANGHERPGGLVSTTGGVSATGILEQELLPPPPLPPEIGEYTPPPPLNSGS